MSDTIRLGIDLGGTKTEIIALDTHGNTLLRQRSSTQRQHYHSIVTQLTAMVQEACKQLQIERYSLGIGIPGAMSPATGKVKNANTTCLIGQDLLADLRSTLAPVVPLRIANDADCFALSEARDGAGKGFDAVFGVILGTGCGGGWVINGALLNGPNAISGEWGHNPMPWQQADEPSLPCYCGKQGCIETFLSGPGLQLHGQHRYQQQHSAEHWHQLAQQGDEAAQGLMQRYQHNLARALASVINLMDPPVIVLGGGMSNIESLYSAVPALWPDYVFSDQVTTQLRRAQHGDSSGVRGAAWLGAGSR
ncbi:transcriptional regulator [Bacterioplanes sanyensis]|uniref:Transcriptional regulator n=1 Tax=Bacterioplanes sanyensis TaxID=1249553 RepID=A0A222FK51_9GAMM|nr:ROK family protein [Bacterioplanes sanyensis]ASP38956.1 transcriptional regulator [Bacterioplanes sanyensis]